MVELSDISVHVIKDHDMFYDLVSWLPLFAELHLMFYTNNHNLWKRRQL